MIFKCISRFRFSFNYYILVSIYQFLQLLFLQFCIFSNKIKFFYTSSISNGKSCGFNFSIYYIM